MCPESLFSHLGIIKTHENHNNYIKRLRKKKSPDSFAVFSTLYSPSLATAHGSWVMTVTWPWAGNVQWRKFRKPWNPKVRRLWPWPSDAHDAMNGRKLATIIKAIFWQLFGLFMQEVWLNSRLKSSKESFGSILV